MTQPTSSSRSTNIIIRVTPEQRDLIDQAALLNNKTQADFILEAATRPRRTPSSTRCCFPSQSNSSRRSRDFRRAHLNRINA
jgi:hypothetical protein